MTVVIVGGGLAAGSAAVELRKTGYAGEVVLFAAEPHLPYERPPLSKGYLMGKDPLDQAFVKDKDWYAANNVDVRLATRVTGIDRAARAVVTDAGEQTYERVLLATGAVPRRLELAEAAGPPVAYLRTIEDSDRLKAAFGAGRRVCIVGGGWIGLEVAAAARAAGTEVTLFEAAELPLLGVLGERIARVFADLHRAHGVDLRLGTQAAAADLDADLIVVGVGVAPDAGLAAESGLDVDNGILVDEQLRTSDPALYAAGDVANHLHPVLGRRVRVEHWDTARQQGRVAARNLAGAEERYERLPYFFTDQYDLGLEYVGHGSGSDELVVRGSLDPGGPFRAYWVREGTVVAAMHVNDWDAMKDLRRVVGGPATRIPD